MEKTKLENYLNYTQPTKFIVSSEEYSDEYKTPVLTAGKTFILGYTNEMNNIYAASKENPIILFDDFTTECKWVDFPFKVKSSACKILTAVDNKSIRYSYYAMKSAKFDNSIHKRYWISLYSQIDVVDRSEEEKQIVVNKLDSISKMIDTKKTQLFALDELIKSRFIEMFGDPNTNDKNWNKGIINDIGQCVAGATPSTKIIDYWENGTISWMSSGEVNKERIFETDTKITQLGYDNASTKLVPPHTVVLAMAGQGKTRGTAAITEIELCTNQSICSIVNNEKVNPEYLLFFLKMQYQELRNASNGADGRGGLNLKIIGNYPIIIPPKELQDNFALLVEQIDKSKFIVQSQIKDLQELLDKKMDEYFRMED